MNPQRDGAGATPDLQEVDEASAPSSIQAVFADVREVLRVPFVDQFWRVLARAPEFLPHAWAELVPALGSTAAERAADELRREALIPLALELPSHKAFRGDMSRAEIGSDDRDRISNFTMAAHYVLPKLLLAAALLQGGRGAARHKPEPAEMLPRGVAEGAPNVNPIDPGNVRGEGVELFAEIRTRHGYDAIADYYRTIVMAGDFLRVAWNALRPLVGDPEYVGRAVAVTARARALANDLAAEETEPAPAGAAAIAPAITFYLERLLPETLIEVTVIKGLMDGPHTAAYNRYSLTDSPPAGGVD